MKKSIIAVAGTALFLLAACTNDGKDFKENAEAYIGSTTIESQLQTTFSDTVCTEPAKIEAGETFTCTAVDAGGATWNFDVAVISKNSYNVVSATSLRRKGEKFVEGTEVATQTGTTFTQATCTDPATTDVGATFTCTAVAADGAAWDFTLAITGVDTFEITDGQPRP